MNNLPEIVAAVSGLGLTGGVVWLVKMLFQYIGSLLERIATLETRVDYLEKSRDEAFQLASRGGITAEALAVALAKMRTAEEHGKEGSR